MAAAKQMVDNIREMLRLPDIQDWADDEDDMFANIQDWALWRDSSSRALSTIFKAANVNQVLGGLEDENM